jgi:hypothetical protein
MKNKILTKISQKLADFIYNRLSESKSHDEIKFWFNFGMTLDNYLITFHEIYLD